MDDLSPHTGSSSPPNEGMSTINVPNELVGPLSGLIKVLTDKLLKNSDSIDVLLDTNNDIHLSNARYGVDCNEAIADFKKTKTSLMDLMTPFNEETLNKNLSDDSFTKFKEIRKKLSAWYRLGMATIQREDNTLVHSHDIIKTDISVSASCEDKILRQKIYSDLLQTKNKLEREVRLHSFSLLTTKTTDIDNLIENIEENTDSIIWAKAFRAVSRTYSNHSSRYNSRRRSVSFSSDNRSRQSSASSEIPPREESNSPDTRGHRNSNRPHSRGGRSFRNSQFPAERSRYNAPRY